MFSRKEVFENYLGKLGLNKTVFEAVKDINGVLFEGIDDELDEFDDDVRGKLTGKLPDPRLNLLLQLILLQLRRILMKKPMLLRTDLLSQMQILHLMQRIIRQNFRT